MTVESERGAGGCRRHPPGAPLGRAGRLVVVAQLQAAVPKGCAGAGGTRSCGRRSCDDKPVGVELARDRRSCWSATTATPSTRCATGARTAACRSRSGGRSSRGPISCPYHGWTFDLDTGVLRAVITDGPDSPICGKVAVETYPAAERLGMVWVFIGDSDGRRRPSTSRIPTELREHEFSMGGRIDIRRGDWRYAAENGFDEGHAKYLHRTSLWRLFKVMPAWNEDAGRSRRTRAGSPGCRTRCTGRPSSPGSGAGPTSAGGAGAPRCSDVARQGRRGRPDDRRAGRRRHRARSACPACCASPTRSSSTTSGTCRSTRTATATCS